MLGRLRRWRAEREGERALKELDRLQQREGAVFGFIVHERLDEALNALRRGDAAHAAKLWDQALAAAPQVAKRAPQAADILIRLGRADEAEALMLDGMKRFPGEPSFYAGYASVAAHRRDWEEALARWRTARAKFPLVPDSYRNQGLILRELGRLDEAERVLGEAGRLRDVVVAIEFARVAAKRADWPTAYARWEQVERFGHHSAYAGKAEALAGMGRFDEADSLLATAHHAFPLEQDISYGMARVAEARGDWTEAARLWSIAARRFPHLRHGFEQAREARLKVGDAAGAEAVAAEMRERFPDTEPARPPEPAPVVAAPPQEKDARPAASDAKKADLLEAARAALRNGDMQYAPAAFAEVRRGLPDEPAGWIEGARCCTDAGRFEDAEALLSEGLERFPRHGGCLADLARLVERRGNWAAAEPLWRRFIEAHDGFWWGPAALAKTLVEQGRPAEAEAALASSIARWPDEIGPRADHARLAEARGDWPEAQKRWTAAVKHLPGRGDAYVGLAAVLRRHGDAAADAVLREGLERLPDDDGLKLHLAIAAEHRGAGDEAVSLLRSIVAGAASPDWGHMHLVGMLGRLRRGAEAETALRAAMDAFPQNPAAALELARLADRHGDWAEAALRWGAVREQFPAVAEAYPREVAALRKSGDAEAASARLDEALKRTPDDPETCAEAARRAFASGDWDGAISRWEEVRRRRPGDTFVTHRLFEARSFAAQARNLTGADAAGRGSRLSDVAPLSLGRRLVRGGVAPERIVQPDWRPAHIDVMARWVADNEKFSHVHSFAAAQLDASERRHDVARARIGQTVDAHEDRYPDDAAMFRNLLQASVLTSQWDVARRLLCDRYRADWCSDLGLLEQDLGPECVLWEAGGDGRSSFLFGRSFFRENPGWLMRWAESIELFFDYTTWPGKHLGSVVFSTGDFGAAPGLAPSDFRPDRFLIPDPHFLGSSGHARLRIDLAEASPSWGERKPVALWRGSAFRPFDRDFRASAADWREVPRIKLCLMAQAAADGIIDAGLTDLGVGFFSAEDRAEFDRFGLRRAFVPQREFVKYKYQIDIDGVSNAWAALFAKLLTGSTVLKVQSWAGFRQWYYDELVPWEHFVPVESDVSDLLDKIRWLQANDDEARRIGQRGQALAQSLTLESELVRARETISAAMRHFSGQAAAA